MSEWLVVNTPNPDIWSEQSYTIRKQYIAGLKLSKNMGGHGADNAVEVTVLHYTGAATNRIWIRCPDFEAAKTLYEDLQRQLGLIE